jgi:hypothetical protein
MDMKLGRLKAIASLVFLIATALVGLPATAGIFDDGNDRLLLIDLRKKPASVLTAMATLVSAPPREAMPVSFGSTVETPLSPHCT